MLSPFAAKTIVGPLAAGIVAIVGLGIAPSHARVGVTSQTDGDPLGRPPAAAERVLRVGIDIQANEVITTKADDRAHIVFLDGTSLTVAPNARLVIDKFVYDATAKKGDLAISASKGVFRLVGGKVSKTTPMVVTTPSATVGIRGGIGLIVVDADETRVFFLFGQSMTVSANGRTEMATRAGSQIITRLGGLPGAPALASSAELAPVLAAFEPQGGSKSDAPDRKAKESGFSERNSGKSESGDDRSSPPALTDQASHTLSNADLQRQSAMPSAGAAALGAGTILFTPSAPSSGPLAGPVAGPLPSPSPLPAGPVPGSPATPTAGPLPGAPPPAPPPTGGPPPSSPPTQSHRATPAIGVGNGGLTPAIPAGPSQGRR